MKTNTNPLTHFEQRGLLTYMKSDFSYRTVEGWFFLNGNTVVIRKIRGRNRSNFCNASDVLFFNVHNK